MKILYITTKAEYGGVQTHILQCSKYMKDRGCEVAVMACPGGVLERSLKEIGVQFYANPFLKNAYDPFLGWRAVRAIQKAVTEFKPDIVSLHSSAAGFWGRLAIRNSVPTIFTAHGWAFTPGAPAARRIIAILAEKLTASFAQKIICVSEYDRDLGIKYRIASPQKIQAIHNGVELTSLPKKQNQKEEKSIPIVFVGRLSGQKDPELLMKAFQSLPNELRSLAHLYFIGDGEKKPVLESLAAPNDLLKEVSFLGEMPRVKVLETLEQFTRCSSFPIFVLTSKYEGLPRSILEAMSFGYAIIASDVGGVKEELAGNAGIIVPANDLSALQSALERLLKSENERAALAKRARLRVAQEFSLGSMLAKTEVVYLSILKK